MDEIIKMVFVPDLTDEKISRVVYFFDKDNAYGGVTVAYKPVLYDTNGNPTGNFAYVAVAYCHPRERFDRKVGKELALQDLQDGVCIRMPIYESGHPVRFLRDVFGVYK